MSYIAGIRWGQSQTSGVECSRCSGFHSSVIWCRDKYVTGYRHLRIVVVSSQTNAILSYTAARNSKFFGVLGRLISMILWDQGKKQVHFDAAFAWFLLLVVQNIFHKSISVLVTRSTPFLPSFIHSLR